MTRPCRSRDFGESRHATGMGVADPAPRRAAGERDEPLERAIGAAKPSEAVSQHAAREDPEPEERYAARCGGAAPSHPGRAAGRARGEHLHAAADRLVEGHQSRADARGARGEGHREPGAAVCRPRVRPGRADQPSRLWPSSGTFLEKGAAALVAGGSTGTSSMSARSFLDTNVLLYTDSSDAPTKWKRALELLGEHRLARSGVVSLQVPQE